MEMGMPRWSYNLEMCKAQRTSVSLQSLIYAFSKSPRCQIPNEEAADLLKTAVKPQLAAWLGLPQCPASERCRAEQL